MSLSMIGMSAMFNVLGVAKSSSDVSLVVLFRLLFSSFTAENDSTEEKSSNVRRTLRRFLPDSLALLADFSFGFDASSVKHSSEDDDRRRDVGFTPSRNGFAVA